MKLFLATIALTGGSSFVQAQEIDAGGLPVQGLRLVQDAGFPIVQGDARNLSGVTIGKALVTFNLLGAEGQVLGNAVAMGTHIAPGQTWHFEAHGPVTGVARAEVREVKAFK